MNIYDINVMNIKVRKIDENLPDFKVTEKGDCVDLYASHILKTANKQEWVENLQKTGREYVGLKEVKYKQGDVLVIRLGFSMELPKGMKANVYPRSSLFKNYGLLLTNSVGIIDNSYKGNDDEWMAIFYCTRNGVINQYDRILQFEIVPVMPKPTFEYVDSLDKDNRDGFGSTGTK